MKTLSRIFILLVGLLICSAGSATAQKNVSPRKIIKSVKVTPYKFNSQFVNEDFEVLGLEENIVARGGKKKIKKRLFEVQYWWGRVNGALTISAKNGALECSRYLDESGEWNRVVYVGGESYQLGLEFDKNSTLCRVHIFASVPDGVAGEKSYRERVIEVSKIEILAFDGENMLLKFDWDDDFMKGLDGDFFVLNCKATTKNWIELHAEKE